MWHVGRTPRPLGYANTARTSDAGASSCRLATRNLHRHGTGHSRGGIKRSGQSSSLTLSDGNSPRPANGGPICPSLPTPYRSQSRLQAHLPIRAAQSRAHAQTSMGEPAINRLFAKPTSVSRHRPGRTAWQAAHSRLGLALPVSPFCARARSCVELPGRTHDVEPGWPASARRACDLLGLGAGSCPAREGPGDQASEVLYHLPSCHSISAGVGDLLEGRM